VKIVRNQTVDGPHWHPEYAMEVNGTNQLFGYRYSLKYLLCSAEDRNSYRFGTTWGWWSKNRYFGEGVWD